MVKYGNYFVFPGGGTQFKNGVKHYITTIEKVMNCLSLLLHCLHTVILETDWEAIGEGKSLRE